jgi:hypothetical protein
MTDKIQLIPGAGINLFAWPGGPTKGVHGAALHRAPRRRSLAHRETGHRVHCIGFVSTDRVTSCSDGEPGVQVGDHGLCEHREEEREVHAARGERQCRRGGESLRRRRQALRVVGSLSLIPDRVRRRRVPKTRPPSGSQTTTCSLAEPKPSRDTTRSWLAMMSTPSTSRCRPLFTWSGWSKQRRPANTYFAKSPWR